MIISEKNALKVKEALDGGKSFALIRLPGKVAKFVDAKSDKIKVKITPWLSSEDIEITDVQSAKPVDELPAQTSKEEYLSSLTELIERLSQRDEAKTVISRIIAGQSGDKDWISVAEKLWSHFPDTLGYLFYTPQTGAWLGASPEKLLRFFQPDHFSTMALAGTVPVNYEWDYKNYQEQQIVEKYIADIVKHYTDDFRVEGPKSLKFGDLQHLCTFISGRLSQSQSPRELAVTLMHHLSPTPALCGFPLHDAIADIESLENHHRGVYGGFITIEQDSGFQAYVAIRCLQFDPKTSRWAIYTGSGITAKSVPETEWRETQAKADFLLSLL